jgi:gliding motility-associated-like protein
MNMKKIIGIIFLFFSMTSFSQTLTPQVINSAGQFYPSGVNGVYLTDNVGEAVITTIGSGSVIITQGFLQPDIPSILGHSLTVQKNDVSCKDKKDGNISLSISNLPSGAQVIYSWTPANACPGNNCSNLDSLQAGTYSVKVIMNYTVGGVAKMDSVSSNPITINDQNGTCRVKIYNAVSPNGDGNNDTWQIDNITEFPNNHVTIYNRWGTMVFEAKPYTNNWPAKDDWSKLTASTYFYVLDLGDGTPALKGWVEVIRN